MKAGETLGVEADQPAMGALARDPHGLGHMGDGHSLVSDPFDQQTPAMKRQSSITVTHEDLRLVKTDISTAPEVFFRSTRHRPPGRIHEMVTAPWTEQKLKVHKRLTSNGRTRQPPLLAAQLLNKRFQIRQLRLRGSCSDRRLNQLIRQGFDE